MRISLPSAISSRTSQLLIIILLVICIFMLERVGWAQRLQQITQTALQPIEYAGMQTATVLELPFFVLEQERENAAATAELKKSYAHALARLSELEAVEKENQALRAVITQTSGKVEKKRLAAPVLSYALTAVALGSDDGVQSGALVYIADVLVGRITTVSRDQAQVQLFSSRDAEPVLVITESGTEGLLVGTGKRTELTQIPIQAVVSQGERLTTVGQPGIPPGQFVGIVASVSQPATAPMQTAVIDQLQSFYAASLVEIR